MHLQTDSGTSTFLCLDDEVWFGWILACHSKDQAGSAGVAESQAISQPHWNVLQFFLCTRNRCAHTMPLFFVFVSVSSLATIAMGTSSFIGITTWSCPGCGE